jgi:hypothetical protein
MALARKRYESDHWTVEDVSRTNDEEDGTPYDLRCTRGSEVRHVEVKGTSGNGTTVSLSWRERDHASDHPGTAHLFVVERIGLKTRNGDVVAVGGTVRFDGPFRVDGWRFKATQYRYIVPSTDESPPE